MLKFRRILYRRERGKFWGLLIYLFIGLSWWRLKALGWKRLPTPSPGSRTQQETRLWRRRRRPRRWPGRWPRRWRSSLRRWWRSERRWRSSLASYGPAAVDTRAHGRREPPGLWSVEMKASENLAPAWRAPQKLEPKWLRLWVEPFCGTLGNL